MKVVAGSSNLPLAQAIAHELGTEMVSVEIDAFSNGEKRIHFTEELHGQSVVVVQSFSNPVDSHIMETLLLLDALERHGVRHVSLVVPWMGYSLQDKVFRPGEPISAKVVANLLSHAYVKRIFLFDLHNSSIPGFFSVPTYYLTALEIFKEYLLKELVLDDMVIASPDFGGLKRARTFAELVGAPLAKIEKQRDLETGKPRAISLNGEDVAGKTVVLFDDCIVSGGTVIETASLLKKSGAEKIYFLASHGLLVNNAAERLAKAEVEKIVITDSIHHENLPETFEVLHTAETFAGGLKKWM